MKDNKSVRENLDWYQNQTLETQISLFGNFLEVAKLLANQILEDEVKEKQNQHNDISTQLEPELKAKSELQADDWLCIICNKKITSDKDRFEFDNQSEFQFINPGGYLFDIITFCPADGCREDGEPTMEFTWFPGHSWSFAFCSRCASHLGWKYHGKFSFYGLIKSRLIKGAALFN